MDDKLLRMLGCEGQVGAIALVINLLKQRCLPRALVNLLINKKFQSKNDLKNQVEKSGNQFFLPRFHHDTRGPLVLASEN